MSEVNKKKWQLLKPDDSSYVEDNSHAWHIAGGYGKRERKYLNDILIYDGNQDKWTKVGDLCYGRSNLAISLVPEDFVDHCILDIDC